MSRKSNRWRLIFFKRSRSEFWSLITGRTSKKQRSRLSDYASYFEERFVKGLSIRKYAQAHGLNRGSADHLQRKFFAAFAQALKKRDEADSRNRLQVK